MVEQCPRCEEDMEPKAKTEERTGQEFTVWVCSDDAHPTFTVKQI